MTLPALLALTLAVAAEPLSPEPPAVPSQDPPVLRAQIGMPVAWRSYLLVPDGGVGVEYRTDRPYLGLDLGLELDPSGPLGRVMTPDGSPLLRHLATHLGLAGRLSLAWLRSSFTDSSGQQVGLGSSERRASADLLYRIPVEIFRGTRAELRTRLGAGLHQLALERAGTGLESSRWSLRLGLDATQPIFPSWQERLAIVASAVAMPFASPGPAERSAHGAQSSGWGFELSAGAAGGLDLLAAGLGWRLALDYTRYLDQLGGTGTLSLGGSTAETYVRLVAAITYAR